MAGRYVVIALFLAGACLLWLPFHTQHTAYATRSVHAVPAGQITKGFVLRQTVRPRLRKISAATNESGGLHCFGLRFATYQRTNAGDIDVRWQQDDRTEGWRVDAADLQDNAYRYFCPQERFEPMEPFDLEVKGVDGRAGHAATLWLTVDTRFGTATLDGGTLAGKALALDVTKRERHEMPSLFSIDHGAFLLGWLCTLLVGAAALFSGFGVNSKVQ